MSNLITSISRRPDLGICIAMVLAVAGCGVGEYEMRLGESRKYYAYLDKIEQSLAPKWSVTGNLMELRVPKQFYLIPAPVAVKNADGELEMPAVDPRQPDYINLTLPGLFGAWYSDFVVNKADGTKEDRKGYIYVVSNYDELATDKAVDAGEFVTTLKTYLTEQLGIPVSDERTEIHPKVTPAYQPQLTYEAFTFKGKSIDGVNFTFDVYARQQGSVICAIIVVLPEGMDSPQKVTERIPMMLESFSFTRVPPKPGATTNNPKAGPQQPAPGGF